MFLILSFLPFRNPRDFPYSYPTYVFQKQKQKTANIFLEVGYFVKIQFLVF